VIAVPEDPSPGVTSGTPADPDGGPGPGARPGRDDVGLADGTRLTGALVGHLADQARRTADAAKAGRVVNRPGEPGVLDLTPLRELLSELVEELGKLRLRERAARALRQAADVIDTQPPGH
jgi:hypothetical protein